MYICSKLARSQYSHFLIRSIGSSSVPATEADLAECDLTLRLLTIWTFECHRHGLDVVRRHRVYGWVHVLPVHHPHNEEAFAAVQLEGWVVRNVDHHIVSFKHCSQIYFVLLPAF